MARYEVMPSEPGEGGGLGWDVVDDENVVLFSHESEAEARTEVKRLNGLDEREAENLRRQLEFLKFTLETMNGDEIRSLARHLGLEDRLEVLERHFGRVD